MAKIGLPPVVPAVELVEVEVELAEVEFVDAVLEFVLAVDVGAVVVELSRFIEITGAGPLWLIAAVLVDGLTTSVPKLQIIALPRTPAIPDDAVFVLPDELEVVLVMLAFDIADVDVDIPLPDVIDDVVVDELGADMPPELELVVEPELELGADVAP